MLHTTSTTTDTPRSGTSVTAHLRATSGHHIERTSSPQAPTARRARRTRRLGALAGAAMVAVLVTGCFPTGPVETWVPDLDSDGEISQPEIDQQMQVIMSQGVAAVEAHRGEVQRHPFLACIRHHESDRGAYPHTNGYGAHNPGSSAAGAYQFLDSTWRNVSARAGHAGYDRASKAPWYVQDEVALWFFNNGGRSAWRGSGC